MKKQVLIYLEPEIHKKLKVKAANENTNVTKLISQAIKDFLD